MHLRRVKIAEAIVIKAMGTFEDQETGAVELRAISKNINTLRAWVDMSWEHIG